MGPVNYVMLNKDGKELRETGQKVLQNVKMKYEHNALNI